MSRTSQLEQMMKDRTFVRFSRRYEETSVKGYVLGVGPRFFLLLLVSDRILFDGFECFRISDISKLRPDPYAAFVESALKMRGHKKPMKPRINLQSVEKILQSANRAFPLVTIHLEGITPDVCHIGRVASIGKSRVSLIEIAPDAAWDSTPSEYKLSNITRVNFGGSYEDALHIVGGEPFAG